MTYKIKHESKGAVLLAAASAAVFVLIVVFSGVGFSVRALVLDLAAALLALLWFIVERLVGASITVGEELVTIRRLLGRKRIAYSEIVGLDIENYSRTRRKPEAFVEYRMRMTISLASGGRVVLNDLAGRVKGAEGFVLGKREKLPDEEVELYKAYRAILAKLDRI